MSEADGSGPGREIWIEKYRPETLDDVNGQDDIVDRLQSYIERDDLPHLLFSGPAGVGKCVTGETPVVTNRGVERIGDVVGDTDGFDSSDDGLAVLTFDDDGSFRYVEPSHVFGKDADDLVRVTTRDGTEVTVTPEHALLTIGRDGLEWIPARDLDAGSRVVRPRHAPLPDGDGGVDWIDAMDGDRTFVHVTDEFAATHDIPIEENYIGKKRRVVAGLRRGESPAAIAEAVDTPEKTVQSSRRTIDVPLHEPSTTCSLSYLRELDASEEALRTHVTEIQYVNRNNQRSEPISPPWELTPALAAFVGLTLSEARIDGGRVKFYNNDDGLLDRFETTARSAFDVEPRTGIQSDVPYREVCNRTLTHFLEACFGVVGGSSDVGTTLVSADAESRAAFLRAVFDAEGHVTKQGILELTQKDESLITLLSYLLAGFGVPSRRKRVENAATNGSDTEREYHALYISSAGHLEAFAEHVGFSIDRKATRLADNVDRDSNPNNDTMPTQEAVETLCEELYLRKTDHIPDALDSVSPGRERYLDCLDSLVDAAVARLDEAERALERIDALAPDIESVTAVPATWVGARDELEPIETRRTLSEQVGVRSDCLLEYADGRRTPGSERTVDLLDHRGESETGVDIDSVRTTLGATIEALNVPYAHVADGTGMRGTDVQSLLDGGNDIESLPRFRTVADRVRSTAAGMLCEDVLDALTTLHVLTSGDLYFDEVESVEPIDDTRRVYDLTVPETRNYVAGRVPTVMHNTTCATAIAREVYGDDWRGNFLELNASDQRGIDVVRDRIKNFARSSFGGFDYRIIFLDEADSLCVPPGTDVVTGSPSNPEVKPIEEVSGEGEPIPSVNFGTNEIQSDSGELVESGVADFFEVELEDGRTIQASLSHPFFVVGEDGRLVETELRELSPGDEIADFKDDIGVSRCEICDEWTAGRFCSVDCKDDGHSRDMSGERNPMYGTTWSDERRRKIVEKPSDGRFAGENTPNYGGSFHGAHVWEMDDDTVERVRETTDGGLRAVDTVEISRIEHSHRGKAYNISMDGTPNFMLANGILTHNTSDAQSALRRTMEQFADNTRFILSCNYSSRIIDPIQSRCALFRFSPLPDDAVAAQVEEIAAAEGIDLTDDGLDALVYAAGGDMRRAINTLQAAATTGETVDDEAVYTVTSTVRPEKIESMIEAAIDGDFPLARSTLETLLVDSGMAGGDVIDQLHRSAWEFDLDDRQTVRLMERLGEADYRITEGANEQVQLEAMLAALALDE